MDPSCAATTCRAAWLPRTRGDGPIFFERGKSAFPAPPHPRGWTLVADVEHRSEVGSPAPAGMDPPSTSRPWSAPWLPRTRGDGPVITAPDGTFSMAPPHPRGWTRHDDDRQPAMPGSPAPAGMDPGRSGRSVAVSWLPRTRGDGPLSNGRRDRLGGGSPAPAGMDPEMPTAPPSRLGLPRTRGDGPPSRISA